MMELFIQLCVIALVVLVCILLVITMGIKYEVDAIHNELELYQELENERYKDLDRRVEVIEERMESYEIHP